MNSSDSQAKESLDQAGEHFEKPELVSSAGLHPGRTRWVQAPVIPRVHQWIRDNPRAISLAQGAVSYPPPEAVLSAARDIISSGEFSQSNSYGPVAGIEPLRQAILQELRCEKDFDMRGRTTFCTAGSNMAFLASILSITNPDDEVILISPYYFNHEMAVRIAGCRLKIVPARSDFQPDVLAIEQAITPKTRAVVSVSPNNPTGVVYRPEEIQAINRLCRRREIYHIHDEAYEYFVFDEARHFSPLEIPDSHPHTISLFSLSKAYGMAGWRIGYGVFPEHLETPLLKVQDTNLICPTVFSQLLAVEALKSGGAWCRQRVNELATVRSDVLTGLRRIDELRIAPSDGALYFMVAMTSNLTDLEIVQRLICDFGVAVLPGSTFGQGAAKTAGSSTGGSMSAENDSRFLRISFGGVKPNEVAEAISRLSQGLGELAK